VGVAVRTRAQAPIRRDDARFAARAPDARARAAAEEAIAAARAGHGRVVWIAGRARRPLVEWTASHAAASGFEVLRARPGGRRRERPCGVLTMLLHRDDQAAVGAPSAAVAEETAAVLARLLSSLAQVRPVAIVVDRAQLADELSLATLVGLVAQPAELPVLLALGVDSARHRALRDALARLAPDRPAIGIDLTA
jgi:hypothetical protein